MKVESIVIEGREVFTVTFDVDEIGDIILTHAQKYRDIPADSLLSLSTNIDCVEIAKSSVSLTYLC